MKKQLIKNRMDIVQESAILLVNTTDYRECIKKILKMLLNYYDADRAYIFDINCKEQLMYNIFEQCKDGIIPQINTLQSMPLAIIDFWKKEFKNNKKVYIENVCLLPKNRENEKYILKRQNVNSLLAAPFYYKQRLEGFIGVDNLTQNKDDIQLLTTVCNMIFDKLIQIEFSSNDRKLIQDKNIILENSPVGIAEVKIIEEQFIINYISSGFLEMLGYTREVFDKMYGVDAFKSVCKEDRKIVSETILKNISQGILKFDLKYRLISKKGECIWTLVKFLVVIKDDLSKYLYCVYSDITKEQESLMDLQKRYNSVIQQKLSGENTVAYVLADITDDLIIESGPCDLQFAILKKGESVKNISEKLSLFAFLKKDKKKIKEVFSIENMKNSIEKDETLTVNYYRFNNDGKMIYVTTEAKFSQNPKDNHQHAFIYTYDITEKSDTKELVDAVVKREFEYVAKVDVKQDKCLVIFNEKEKINVKNVHKTCSLQEYIDFTYKKIKREKIEKEDLIKRIGERLNNCNSFEQYYDLDDGKRIRLGISVVDRERKVICVVCTDITEMTKHDHDRNLKLKVALKAKEKAEKSEFEKSQFLAKISHDMRTPLASIIGISEFGLDEIENNIYRDYFKQINQSGKYLLGLINDILQTSRLENGEVKLEIKPQYIKEIYNDIENIVVQRAKQKNIKFDIDIDDCGFEYLKLDRVHSNQVIINLLNNAIKYTPKGGTVIWKSRQIKQDNCIYCEHIIEDNGIGISEHFQKKMFLPFEREEKASDIEGIGMGLAIVRRLIDLMDGEIDCKSKKGRGTIFTVKIKASQCTEEEYMNEIFGYKQEIIEKNLSGKKILVCEDIGINVKIVKKILSQKGIIIDVAKNGEIGVQKAKQNDYIAILMDIRMPKMNGLEATKEIRKFDKQIPIIALSANAYEEDIEKSLEVGMNAHVAKPIERNKLYKMLYKLV